MWDTGHSTLTMSQRPGVALSSASGEGVAVVNVGLVSEVMSSLRHQLYSLTKWHRTDVTHRVPLHCVGIVLIFIPVYFLIPIFPFYF